MKAGTWIKLPDGREATVVYYGIDGYGIKWGLHDLPDSFWPVALLQQEPPTEPWEWEPDAMLKDGSHWLDLECVGREFKVVKEGVVPNAHLAVGRPPIMKSLKEEI